MLTHAPGHTPDLITVYVKEDKILFASDTVMPVPYVVDGDAAAQPEHERFDAGQWSEGTVDEGRADLVLEGDGLPRGWGLGRLGLSRGCRFELGDA